MAARLTAACLVTVAAALGAAAGRAQAPSGPAPLPSLVFDVAAGVPSSPPAADVPAALRVTIDAGAADLPTSAVGRWPVWLTLRAVDGPVVEATALPARVRQILAATPRLAAIELQASGDDPRRAAFLIKIAAAEIRAARPQVAIVLGGEAAGPARRDAVITPDVTPSVDALALVESETADPGPAWTWANAHDPGLTLVDLHAFLAEGVGFAPFVAHESRRLGTFVTTRGYRVEASQIGPLVRVARRFASLYRPGDLAPLTPSAGEFTLTIDGRDATPHVAPRLLYHLSTLSTFLLFDGAARAGAVADVSLVTSSGGEITAIDLLDGREQKASRETRDELTQRSSARFVLAGKGPWLVTFASGAEGGFVQQEDVTADRTPSVEEILARHQARQAAEREASPRYVMNGRIQQFFKPNATDPGFDIVTENRFFVDRVDGTEWEEREFRVNGAKFGEPRPPFPLLQPEKVLAPPLVIELDARYAYRLQGSETVGGRAAWVVAFEPARRDQSLYRGTVWIDRETYARLRQQAVQTGLTAPVVSNDETQDFAPVRTARGQDVYLPSRIYNQQLILIAGRPLLVERRVTFDGYAIAPDDFSAQRQEARGGASTMYRDTAAGVRYFIKEGTGRVVSDMATTKAKAMALGLTIDPGFDFPLPIGGINYLNFRFRGRPDTQVAILFAGVLAAGNIQRPKAIANRIDASVDFFLMAPPSSDRLFLPGGEREDQRLLTWPLSTGLNLGWQATSYQRLSAQYQFRFDGYVRDSTTSDTFVTPSTTVTNGIGGLYEYRRGGYAVTGNAVWARRASWRAWGEPGALVDTSPDYTKFSLAGTKVFYLGPLSKFVVNGAWYGGDQLDRFSQYQFGLFDETKVHGVPSAGVRYGELAMARGQYSFNLFEQYRVDLFVDRAWGRVRGDAAAGIAEVPWEPLTGLGVAFNVRIPGRTAILRGEVGKSFLPSRYRGLGSTTVQIMLLKPL
jgi:hypothetical protein